MTKQDHLLDKQSPLNQAHMEEPLLILRACDRSATYAILCWMWHRIITGQNKMDDSTILAAKDLKKDMETYRDKDA